MINQALSIGNENKIQKKRFIAFCIDYGTLINDH